MIVSKNYLDPDMAYVLGLIVARGTLYESGSDKRVVIEFPYKNLEAEGIKKKYNQSEHLRFSLNQIRERIYELTETDIQVVDIKHSAQLIIRFLRNSIFWRNVNYILGYDKKSYYDFEIPKQVFDSPIDIQKEFVRGMADVAGFIRHSNNYMGNKRRVYLEISNRNWDIPVQICSLLQTQLKVPVQCIQWGHPNTREPRELKKGITWAREHQVKIFSEAFLPIGFYVKYKQDILEEFAEADEKLDGNILFCNPNPKVRRFSKKPKHPEEKNRILPKEIRGKHFNSAWEICVCMGCKQKKRIYTPQLQFIPDDDITSVKGNE